MLDKISLFLSFLYQRYTFLWLSKHFSIFLNHTFIYTLFYEFLYTQHANDTITYNILKSHIKPTYEPKEI